MAICVVCSSEIRDDARFCPSCGAEQPKAQTASGEDPLLGKVVARKFKIEKLLGVGGMGKVYKAVQLSLDKAVVVKVLHDQFRDDPQLVQRFQREAKAASRLNHPNSIQIIDFGQDEGGVVFMAMEFLQGQDLFAVLKRDGALAPDRLARIMMQVCSALAEAHEQNVIHRDLKPENIMVEDRRGSRDHVKVLDFGIAKIQDPAENASGQALTQAGMVCGTPEYMSPEQARGMQLDARSDIYALGVVMYQLATGVLPFVADTPIGIVTKHILEKPVPPRQKRPELPIELETIILRAMEKEVAGRFSSVTEMHDALEAYLRANPATLPAVSPQTGGVGGFVPSPSPSGAFVPPPSTNPGASAHNTAATPATAPTAPPGTGGPSTPTGVASSPSTVEALEQIRPAGSPAMKAAAALAVVVLLGGGAAVFAMKDKLFGPACGNGKLEAAEQCDDGNLVAGDACSATCTLEPVCGNGKVETGEVCDDGNTASNDGCSSSCAHEVRCGDGTKEGSEACDDGNTAAGDGCSTTCTVEPRCGDGKLEAPEACDDGNTLDGDGCSSVCVAEAAGATGTTPPSPTPGNGTAGNGNGGSGTVANAGNGSAGNGNAGNGNVKPPVGGGNDRAAATALYEKAKTGWLPEKPCSDAVRKGFFDAAQADKTWPQPLFYLVQCMVNAGAKGAGSPSCAAAGEFTRRGGGVAQANILNKMACK